MINGRKGTISAGSWHDFNRNILMQTFSVKFHFHRIFSDFFPEKLTAIDLKVLTFIIVSDKNRSARKTV
ncbi:MAG: hypothetical protein AMS27_03245 [Bacteroides sp. SM23_62_1]|nr:MAG: hypothetical protein AMS27_03245 [Bacteroides sp. SM23_62_1]